MSTADARWLYDISQRGDVVEYTGTDRPMALDNGYGDWKAPCRRTPRVRLRTHSWRCQAAVRSAGTVVCAGD